MLTLTITSFSVMPCFLPYHHSVNGNGDGGDTSDGGVSVSVNAANSGNSANDNGGDGGIAVKGAANAGNGATCSTTNSGNGRMGSIAILGEAADGEDANGVSNGNNGV